VPPSLGLSDADLKPVLHEANEQTTPRNQCIEQVEKLKPLLDVVPVPDADINAETKTIQIECRSRTLDARDRLLKTLSPEGVIALSAWIENGKTHMQVRVPKGEMAHYRQPQ
jgi:hypothetical protein